MFSSPEHALSASFGLLQRRIEPRNGTGAVVAALRARPSRLSRANDGMSAHDWHAQAAMVVSLAERILSPHPLLWQAVQAEYGSGVGGALAVQAVGDAWAPGLPGQERLLIDMLLLRAFRGGFSLREIADRFGMSKSTVARHAQRWEEPVARLRARAVAELQAPFAARGLIDVMVA